MEELALEEFVHRVCSDEKLREELKRDASTVIIREGFTPRVAQAVLRLVPHLSLDKPLDSTLRWWCC